MTPIPKKRRSRPYDSARTAPRSTGQRSVSRPSGYQEQELTFETRRAPSQNTTRSRAYDFESQRPQQGTSRPRADDFESQRPQQGTSRPRAYDFEGQRPRQGTSRPRQDNSIQFPTQQVRRPGGRQQPEQNSPHGTASAPGTEPAAAPQAPADDPGRDAPPPVGTPTDGLWAFALRHWSGGLSDRNRCCLRSIPSSCSWQIPPRWNRRADIPAR